MSQAGTIEASGGPGGDLTSLTGDTGGPVFGDGAGNINVLGQKAGTVQVFETPGSPGTFTIRFEDRTWWTQYVVDPDTTVGLRGTFSTIQSALDQAETDGMTNTNPKVIFLRNAEYTENLSIPAGAVIQGEGYVANPSVDTIYPKINGVHTIDANSSTAFRGIYLSNNSAASPTITGDTVGVWILGSIMELTLAAQTHFTFVSGGVESESSFYSGSSFTTGFTSSATSGWFFRNCIFSQEQFVVAAGTVTFDNCGDVGPLVFSAGTVLEAYNTQFFSNTTDVISGAADGLIGSILDGCNFSSATATKAAINATGIFYVTNCGGVTTGLHNLYGSNPTIKTPSFLQGNLIFATRSPGNIVVDQQMHYIGITNTAVARTVTLPISNVPTGRTFLIKDESGLAGTNNITVTCSGGATNIDGAFTAVININYGAMAVIWSGVEYFILP